MDQLPQRLQKKMALIFRVPRQSLPHRQMLLGGEPHLCGHSPERKPELAINWPDQMVPQLPQVWQWRQVLCHTPWTVWSRMSQPCRLYALPLDKCLEQWHPQQSWVITWIRNKLRLEYDCVTNSLTWIWIWLGSSPKTNDWLTDLSVIDLNMTMTWLWIEYGLTNFQLRLSIGRVHACAISSYKLVFLKLDETLFWNLIYKTFFWLICRII